MTSRTTHERNLDVIASLFNVSLGDIEIDACGHARGNFGWKILGSVFADGSLTRFRSSNDGGRLTIERYVAATDLWLIAYSK